MYRMGIFLGYAKISNKFGGKPDILGGKQQFADPSCIIIGPAR